MSIDKPGPNPGPDEQKIIVPPMRSDETKQDVGDIVDDIFKKTSSASDQEGLIDEAKAGSVEPPIVPKEAVDPIKRRLSEIDSSLLSSYDKRLEYTNAIRDAYLAKEMDRANSLKIERDELNKQIKSLKKEEKDLKAEAKKSKESSSTEDVSDDDSKESFSPNVAEEVKSLLETDLDKLNNPEKKSFSENTLTWLQKNTKLRMFTGIAVSSLAALTGMNEATWIARGVLGAAGGAVGYSGLRSGMRERGALKEYNRKMNGCFDKNGNLDETKLAEKVANNEISREDAIDLYAKLTEIASAKGQKVIEKLGETEQTTESKLDKLFPRLKENKAIQWYGRQHWAVKAGLAVAASVGVGVAGASIAGGFGASVAGINLARVLSSGAMQLMMGVKQKSPEGEVARYAYSGKILGLQNILKDKLGGDLTPEELAGIQKYRTDAKKGRSRDVAIGGATVAVLIGGYYALFGHNAAEQANNGVTKTEPSSNGKPIEFKPDENGNLTIKNPLDSKPYNPLAADDKGPWAPSPSSSGNEMVGGGPHPSLIAQPEATSHGATMDNFNKVTSPEHINSEYLDKIKGFKPEDMKDTGIHLKNEYFEKPENIIGANADKHLAETVIRGEMGQPGKYGPMHFNNHAEFNELRDKLVAEMHAKHPDAFNPDGSINEDHIKEVPNLLSTEDVKTDYAAVAALHPATTPEVSHGSGHESQSGANHNTQNPIEHAKGAAASQQAEATSREELFKATGAKVPGTWHSGHNFEAYNSGKPITAEGAIDALKDKQISKDSYNYLQTLYKSGLVKSGDVHLSPDGQHLLVTSPKSLADGIVWSTDIKEKSIFSTLFGGRVVDATSVVPGKTGILDAATQTPTPGTEAKPSDWSLSQGKEAHTTVDPLHSSKPEATDWQPSQGKVTSPEINHATSATAGSTELDHTSKANVAEAAATHLPQAKIEVPAELQHQLAPGAHVEGVHNGVYQIIEPNGKDTYFGSVDTSSTEYKTYFDQAMAKYDELKATRPNLTPLGYENFVKMNAANEILRNRYNQ